MARGLHDLGNKPAYPEAVMASPAPEKSYPCVYGLTEQQLPDLDLYDAGDEVLLLVRAKLKRKEAIEEPDKPKRTVVDLELLAAAVQDEGEAKVRRETGMSKAHLAKAKEKGLY